MLHVNSLEIDVNAWGGQILERIQHILCGQNDLEDLGNPNVLNSIQELAEEHVKRCSHSQEEMQTAGEVQVGDLRALYAKESIQSRTVNVPARQTQSGGYLPNGRLGEGKGDARGAL